LENVLPDSKNRLLLALPYGNIYPSNPMEPPMSAAARSAFPPRKTGLQRAIIALLADLVELYGHPATGEGQFDDQPHSLRDFADFAKRAAAATDALFAEIADQAGLVEAGQSKRWATLVSDCAIEDLAAEILGRADRLEEDRAAESQAARDRRNHSTLNHRQLGLR
jgi:hypothetical protein